MKASKLSALIRSSQSQVSKAATSLKKAEDKSVALEPVFRGAKVHLKDAKQAFKKVKSDCKASQLLVAGERGHFSKLKRKLDRLRRKAAKASSDVKAVESPKSATKSVAKT